MSDLVAAIKESEAYECIIAAFASSRVPHALLIEAPSLFHGSIAIEIARLYLCENGLGDDGCASCHSWKYDEHPDLVRPITLDQPPGISDCRKLMAELYLAPVVAPRRFLVIPQAGRLSLPAANSLLKITEEPPSWAAILLLCEGSGVPPTLKSRTWNLTFNLKEELSILAPPETKDEWLSAIVRASKMTSQEALAMLEGWINWCLGNGELGKAAKLEKIRLISEKGHLPVYMVFDLLYGFLEEDLSDELFGHFR